jgi:hypothetical protein
MVGVADALALVSAISTIYLMYLAFTDPDWM